MDLRHTALAALLLSSIMCIGAMAGAPFELPAGSNVLSTDDSGRTWQMNAWMNGRVPDVCAKLTASLKKAGFKMKHEIKMPGKPESVLYAWTRGDNMLLLMVYEMAPGVAGFNWGLCKE